MNLENLPGWLLLSAYLSLALEMTVFAVPSEASTLQILTGEAETGGGELAAARRRSTLFKLFCYLLPTALGVVLFVLPLVVTIAPVSRGWILALTDEDSTLVVVGLVMILIGRIVTELAVHQLRGGMRQDYQPLQRNGLFGLSRNPILVGMYLFYLGNCVWLTSPLLWAGFLLYTFNMHRRVLMEEGFLRARFGEEYLTYVASVPRYVGLLRSSSENR